MGNLLITPHTPTLDSGRGLRTYGIARALVALAPLDLLYVRFGAGRPAEEYLEMNELQLHAVEPSRGPRRALSYMASRVGGVPEGFARGASPELLAAATRLAGQPGRDQVVADGPVAAAALRSLARHRRAIYNAHNLESAFRHDLDAPGLGSRDSLASFERRLLETYFESWMPTKAEVQAARELAPDARIRHVPNAIDVRRICPRSSPVPGRCALFVGDFTYAPNRQALQFLLDSVWPGVRRRLPEAELLIAGRGLDGPPAQAGVTYLGYLDDVTAAYTRSDCVLVPLRTGGGSPLKFIEALAYGLPVVATPYAARGLDLKAGEHYLEADAADDFAAHVVGVLRDGAPDMAARGRTAVEAHYSIEALIHALSGDHAVPSDDDRRPRERAGPGRDP